MDSRMKNIYGALKTQTSQIGLFSSHWMFSCHCGAFLLKVMWSEGKLRVLRKRLKCEYFTKPLVFFFCFFLNATSWWGSCDRRTDVNCSLRCDCLVACGRIDLLSSFPLKNTQSKGDMQRLPESCRLSNSFVYQWIRECRDLYWHSLGTPENVCSQSR